MSHYGNSNESDNNPKKKPCRSCMDFKSWTSSNNKNVINKDADSAQKVPEKQRTDCPLDVDEIGRSSWNLLHSMAAYYPAKPSHSEQLQMKQFISSLSQLYPCSTCAHDLREDLKIHPPNTTSQHDLSQWMCRLHNTVNRKLGKPQFDCKLVKQRWLEGWKDGSCD